MFVMFSTYFALTLASLFALVAMILKIGALIGDCPQNRTRAKAAAITIATGFLTIGTGGTILIGALMPLLRDQPMIALSLAFGLACLSLGLGFTHAVGLLRAIVDPALTQFEPDNAPMNAPQTAPRPEAA